MDLLEGKSLEAEIDALRVPSIQFTIIGKRFDPRQIIGKTNHAPVIARSFIHA